jgi:hypothetical protein
VACQMPSKLSRLNKHLSGMARRRCHTSRSEANLAPDHPLPISE